MEIPKISDGWHEPFSPHSHSTFLFSWLSHKVKSTPSIHCSDDHSLQTFSESRATAPCWAHILRVWLIPWSSKWSVNTWKDSYTLGDLLSSSAGLEVPLCLGFLAFASYPPGTQFPVICCLMLPPWYITSWSWRPSLPSPQPGWFDWSWNLGNILRNAQI